MVRPKLQKRFSANDNRLTYDLAEPRRLLAYDVTAAVQDFSTIVQSPIIGSVLSSVIESNRDGDPNNIIDTLINSWSSNNDLFLIEPDSEEFEVSFQFGIGGEVDPDIRPISSGFNVDLEFFTGYTVTRTFDLGGEDYWTFARGFELQVGNVGFLGEYYIELDDITETPSNNDLFTLGMRIVADVSQSSSEADVPIPAIFRVEADFEAGRELTFEASTELSVEEFLSEEFTDQTEFWKGVADVFVPYYGDAWYRNAIYGASRFSPIFSNLHAIGEAAYSDTPIGILTRKGATGEVSVKVDDGAYLSVGATLGIGFGNSVAHVGVVFNATGKAVASETIYGPVSTPDWSFGETPDATLEGVKQILANENLTGATVIVHGFQLPGPLGLSNGDSLERLSKAILQKNGGILIDHDIRGNGDEVGFAWPRRFAGEANELVLQFDWRAESNNLSAGWAEAAADRLFTMLVEFDLVDLETGEAKVELHFIAHSFGTAVVSEVTERLATFDVPVDHVTFLDPHDFDQGYLPVDGDQKLFELGQPEGYGAAKYDNVDFMDVYYQTRGVLVPNGRPIPGAHNYWLRDGAQLPETYLGGLFAVGVHSYVWNTFYLGTVIGGVPYGESAPENWNAWDHSGFAFSRIGDGVARRAAEAPNVFFDNSSGYPQDHRYSESWIVDPETGEPNIGELSARGLTPFDITNASWESTVGEFDIYNGDFEFDGDRTGIPGWSHQGGGGFGFVEAVDGDNALHLRQNKRSLKHNQLSIPPAAVGIEFDLKVPFASADDEFVVKFDDRELRRFGVASRIDSFSFGFVPFPSDFEHETGALELQLESPDGQYESVVVIDNIRFTDELPVLVADAGSGYSVQEGGQISLDGSNSISGFHFDTGVTYKWDLDGDGEFGETGTAAARGDELGIRPEFRPNRFDNGPSSIDIALKLETSNESSATAFSSVFLRNTAPYGTISGPAQISANQAVTYHAIVADYSDQDAANFEPSNWSWTVKGLVDEFSGTGTLISFTPTVREKLDISISVEDESGGQRTISRVVNLNVVDAIFDQTDVRIDGEFADANETHLYAV